MSRLRMCAFVLAMLSAPNVSAQMIECPGALPGAHLERHQTASFAERLLGRFMAALGIHGLGILDEARIVDAYRGQPEQLLIKLTYLTLQCQMMLLDSEMTADERLPALRRVFLNYIIRPPDLSAGNLAAYIAGVATSGRSDASDEASQEEIARIEAAIDQSERKRWRERWFIDPPLRNDRPPRRRWSVIVASPRYEDDGWQALRDHQARWPDVHFELDGPFDPESPHYAVVAGRGLGENTATLLLERLKTKGLPDDSYIWRAPPEPGAGGS